MVVQSQTNGHFLLLCRGIVFLLPNLPSAARHSSVMKRRGSTQPSWCPPPPCCCCPPALPTPPPPPPPPSPPFSAFQPDEEVRVNPPGVLLPSARDQYGSTHCALWLSFPLPLGFVFAAKQTHFFPSNSGHSSRGPRVARAASQRGLFV